MKFELNKTTQIAEPIGNPKRERGTLRNTNQSFAHASGFLKLIRKCANKDTPISKSFYLAILFSFLTALAHASEPTAEWIWSDDPDADVSAEFAATIELSQPVIAARIVGAGDGAAFTIYLDEKIVCEVGAHDPLLQRDITKLLSGPKHRLRINALSSREQPAIFLQLEIRFADRSEQRLVTHAKWPSMAVSKGKVDERLLIPAERRVQVAPTDNYEQWKQALGASDASNPASFQASPGFEIELVRTAKPNEDSWVSFAFDPQGRVIIAKEKQGLLRMSLNDHGNVVTGVESLDDTLKEVRGLAFRGPDLYANANNSKGMYRFAGDRNGALAKPELLLATEGGVGHGRNDLAVGPDGNVYSIHGDSVKFSKDRIDLTSPFGKANRHDTAAKVPGEGHLVRYDPKTNQATVVVAGLRNPFGIAFNEDGEMFTYDADAEYDMGAPWYRPTRVNHLTVGGDFGWRAVTKSWPPYYPDHADNALPNIDIGKGSPTSVAFGTKSNFPERYRQGLFILDWAYGRVILVHTLPRGSSYLCSAETFLQGRPLNVTDIAFGPAGDMYLITGGRKTQSALYRVRYAGEKTAPIVKSKQKMFREEHAAKMRKLRKDTEAKYKNTLAADELAEIWPLLGNADPRIRYAARTLLEHQPVENWRKRVSTESDPLTALTALTALLRSGRTEFDDDIVNRLHTFPFTTQPREERELIAFLLAEMFGRRKAVALETGTRFVEKMEAWYPDPNYRVNVELSYTITNWGAPYYTSKTIDLLNTTESQHEQIHHLFMLRYQRSGWTPELRRQQFASLAQLQHHVGGQGMPTFQQKIREESLASLTLEECKIYEPMLKANDQNVSVKPRPFVRKWTTSAAVDALAKLQADDETPNLQHGAELFKAASCSNCHRVGATGTLIGPDLSGVGFRFHSKDILQSIIEPSKVIAENYRSLQVTEKSGKVHVGRVASGGDFRSNKLRLAADPLHPFKITEIEKKEIESQRYSPTSWMPTGLLDTLTANEIRDLLAYLKAGGRVD